MRLWVGGGEEDDRSLFNSGSGDSAPFGLGGGDEGGGFLFVVFFEDVVLWTTSFSSSHSGGWELAKDEVVDFFNNAGIESLPFDLEEGEVLERLNNEELRVSLAFGDNAGEANSAKISPSVD